MTREEFRKTDTYQIVQAMRAIGNKPGIVQIWKNSVENWARMFPDDPAAKAAIAWLPFWQVRPLYTVEELAPIWGALGIFFGLSSKLREVPKSPQRLAFELDFAELPKVILADDYIPGSSSLKVPDGAQAFIEEMRPRKTYYIVERIHHWEKAFDHAKRIVVSTMTLDQFENLAV